MQFITKKMAGNTFNQNCRPSNVCRLIKSVTVYEGLIYKKSSLNSKQLFVDFLFRVQQHEKSLGYCQIIGGVVYIHRQGVNEVILCVQRVKHVLSGQSVYKFTCSIYIASLEYNKKSLVS